MRKIDFSNAINGQTLAIETLNHLQNGNIEAAEAIIQGFTNIAANKVVLLTGFTKDAGIITVPEGWAYYNGEIYEVTGNTSGAATTYWHIKTTYLSIDPIRFANDQYYNVHRIQKLTLGDDATGSVDTFTETNTLKQIVKSAYGISTLESDMSTAKSDINAAKTDIAGLKTDKANAAQEAWKKVGDTGNLQSPDAANFTSLDIWYRKDSLGRVTFRGRAIVTNDAAITAVNLVEIPKVSGYAPVKQIDIGYITQFRDVNQVKDMGFLTLYSVTVSSEDFRLSASRSSGDLAQRTIYVDITYWAV
jgi:hypothetical protein